MRHTWQIIMFCTFRVWRKRQLFEYIASSSEEAVVRCVHICVIRIRLCLQALLYVTKYVFQYKHLMGYQQCLLKAIPIAVFTTACVGNFCFFSCTGCVSYLLYCIVVSYIYKSSNFTSVVNWLIHWA